MPKKQGSNYKPTKQEQLNAWKNSNNAYSATIAQLENMKNGWGDHSNVSPSSFGSRKSAPLVDKEGFASRYKTDTIPKLEAIEIDSGINQGNVMNGSAQQVEPTKEDAKNYFRTNKKARQALSNNPNISAMAYNSMTPEEQQEYQRMSAISNGSVATGSIDAVPFLDQISNVLEKAGNVDDRYSIEAQSQKAMQDNTFGYMLGRSGVELGKYAVVGALAKSIQALSKVGSATSKALGLGEAGSGVFTEMIGDQLVDVTLDTLPQILNDVQDGKEKEQIVRDAITNFGTNAVFNIIGGSVSSIFDAAKKPVREITKNDDVIENAIKQSDEATDAIKSLSDRLPGKTQLEMEQEALGRGNLEQLNSLAQEQYALSRNQQDMDTLRKALEEQRVVPKVDEITQKINDVVPQIDNSAEEVAQTSNRKALVEQARSHEKAYKPTANNKYGKLINSNEKFFNAYNKEYGANDLMNQLVKNFGDAEDVETVKELKDLLNYFAETGDGATLKEARAIAQELDSKLSGKVLMSNGKPLQFAGVGNMDFEHYSTGFSGMVDALTRSSNRIFDGVDTSRITNRLFKDSIDKITDASYHGLSVEEQDALWERAIELANESQKQGLIPREKVAQIMSEAERVMKGNAQGLSDGVKNAGKAVDNTTIPFVETVADVPKADNAIPFVRNMDDVPKTEGDIPSVRNAEPTADMPERPATISNDISGDKKKVSLVRENTIARDAISDAETKGQMDRQIYEYAVNEEKASMEQAAKNLQNFDDCERYYLQDTPKKGMNGVDADTMMGMYSQYSKELKAAREAGDTALADILQTKINRITKNIQTTATAGGQFNQALAKYTRTADGAIMNAEIKAKTMAENIAKNNPKMSQSAKSIADDIEKSVDELWAELELGSEKTIEELKENVEDIIESSVKRGSNKKVIKNIRNNTDRLSDSLARALADRQYEDVQNIMDTFEEIGISGFAGIDGSVRQQVEQIFDSLQGVDYNSKEYVKKENKAFALLADSINAHGTFQEKLDAYRYFSLLSSKRTHVRNITGNSLFRSVTNIKDDIASLIEAGADYGTQLAKGTNISDLKAGAGIERTKTLYNPFSSADRALKKASKENGDDIYRLLADGNKYTSVSRGIEANKRIFESRVLNWLTETNSNLLTLEDEKAMYSKYADSLARYLKANGADASIFDATDEASKQLLKSGQEYAINEAKMAAFHQMSETANKLSELSKSLMNANDENVGKRLSKKVAGAMIEGTIPFKKAPINILKSFVSYSPLNLVNVVDDMNKLRKGSIKPSQLIDDIAKTMTGTGMLIGGYQLARAGWLNGSDESDGNQKFSINLPEWLGGGSYTVDGFAPVSIPFLVGANLYESQSKDGELSINDMASTLASISDPLVETTMLQGISDLLSINKGYSKDDEEESPILNVAGQVGVNYLNQFVPAGLGNIARSVDDTRRSSYTGKTGLEKAFAQSIEKAENKIPFLSKTNEPYLDEWGEKQENVGGSFLGRLAYNNLSPGFYEATDNSGRAVELRRLKKETGAEGVINSGVSTSIQIGKQKVKLTPEELTTYSREAGRAKADLIDTFMGMEQYDSIPDDIKAEIIPQLYNLGNKIGSKATLSDYSNSAREFEIYETEGMEAAIEYIVASKISGAYSGSEGKKAYEAYKAGGADAVQEYATMEQKLKEYGFTTENKSIVSSYEKAMRTGNAEENVDKMLQKESARRDIYKANNINSGKEVDAIFEKAYASGGSEAATQALKQYKQEKQMFTKYGMEDNETARKVYEEKQSEDMLAKYSRLYKLGKQKDKIDMLYSDDFESIPTLDKGYLLAQTISGNQVTKPLKDAGNYEAFFAYYDVKRAADANGNDSLNKKEKALAVTYLMKNYGYTKEQAQIIAKEWYK